MNKIDLRETYLQKRRLVVSGMLEDIAVAFRHLFGVQYNGLTSNKKVQSLANYKGQDVLRTGLHKCKSQILRFNPQRLKENVQTL